jgi:hypothetical protein
MGVIAGIFLASILIKEMRYLVYKRYLYDFTHYQSFCDHSRDFSQINFKGEGGGGGMLIILTCG